MADKATDLQSIEKASYSKEYRSQEGLAKPSVTLHFCSRSELLKDNNDSISILSIFSPKRCNATSFI
jgi:hypothetical protein